MFNARQCTYPNLTKYIIEPPNTGILKVFSVFANTKCLALLRTPLVRYCNHRFYLMNFKINYPSIVPLMSLETWNFSIFYISKFLLQYDRVILRQLSFIVADITQLDPSTGGIVMSVHIQTWHLHPYLQSDKIHLTYFCCMFLLVDAFQCEIAVKFEVVWFWRSNLVKLILVDRGLKQQNVRKTK